MPKVYYTNTGAEGNEKAIAMSRNIRGLPNGLILSRYPSYHGSTSIAMSASGDFRLAFRGEIPGHVRVKDSPDGYPYTEKQAEPSKPLDSEKAVAIWEEHLLKHGPENFAAILTESRSCTSGVYLYDNMYLTRLRALADKYDLLMICDEVASGFWRTGAAMSFHHEGIKPDFVVCSKGMVNGEIPGGALMFGQRPLDYFENNPLIFGSTQYACTLMLATIKSTLEGYVEEDIPSKVKAMEPVMNRMLREAFDKGGECIVDVRNNGGLTACIDFKEGKDKFAMNALIDRIADENCLATRVGPPQDGVCRMYIIPPLIITEEQLQYAFDVVNEKIAPACNEMLASQK